MPVCRGLSERDGLRQPLLARELRRHGGHGEVLKAYARAVEQRDLVVGRAAFVVAVDHRADGGDVALGDQARAHRVLGLADADRLGDLVGEHRGAGEECGIDLKDEELDRQFLGYASDYFSDRRTFNRALTYGKKLKITDLNTDYWRDRFDDYLTQRRNLEELESLP